MRVESDLNPPNEPMTVFKISGLKYLCLAAAIFLNLLTKSKKAKKQNLRLMQNNSNLEIQNKLLQILLFVQKVFVKV